MTEPTPRRPAPPAPPRSPVEAQRGETLPHLVAIMQRLLAPDGCPWDREQTLETLRPYVVEEAHEVVDAIDRSDAADLREELGDLLLQIVFQSEIARQKGWFGPDDVVAAISDKMVRRHPHVFADESAGTSDEVLDAWEKRKAREREAKASSERPKGALDGVPVAMPSLLRAVRIGDKAARVGYDWPSPSGAREKVSEELRELDEAIAGGDRERMEDELGDVLFSLASWARLSSIDPEASLRRTLDRFTTRFREAERLAHERGTPLDQLNDDARDVLWREAKVRTT
ncbi:MAG: nucleoside triphosphate pyrophosphohydrolase [Deltaproteobacteria bacterium]|nr:nucleoside triphosphate pyrophosphohydrolase [Deltaproteobacteria bacterium]